MTYRMEVMNIDLDLMQTKDSFRLAPIVFLIANAAGSKAGLCCFIVFFIVF